MEHDIRTLKQQSENSSDKSYKVIFTAKFKKAWKKYSKSGKGDPERLYSALRILSQGNTLDSSYRDHGLNGNMKDYRECHIYANLLLIYEFFGNELRLINFGTHPELFG